MSNLGLEQAIEGMGLGFVRANVGDRYVMQELESRGWTLGGESSGHLICLDRTTTGDAIVAALAILGAMRSSGSKLSELTEGMVKYPQHMINVPCQNREDVSHPSVQSIVREVEARLGSQGRVLLRPSGTEPLIRVMVEGAHQTLVEESAQVIADCVSSIGH
jgi:phosphoglucosamine mutase